MARETVTVGVDDATAAAHQIARRLGLGPGFANLWPPLHAAPAAPAAGTELEYDMVAWGYIRDGGSNLDNRPRALVPQHQRLWPGARAVHHGEVRMAQPSAADPDQHLVRARRIEGDLLDTDRFAVGERLPRIEPAQHGGFHFHCFLPDRPDLAIISLFAEY